MTVIPADCHSAILVSRANILREAKYKIGRRPSAAACSSAMGLGRDLPFANHVSSSAIQKSLSSCVAIIISSHIIKSPCIVAVRLCVAKKSTTGFCVSVVVDGVGLGLVMSGADAGVGASSSNVMSENVGMSLNIGVLSNGMLSADGVVVSSKSKSVGKGRVPSGVSDAVLVFAVASAGTGWGMLNAVVGALMPMCDRARKNAPCNSVGRCFGISYVSGAGGGGGAASFSGVGSAVGA